MKRFPLAFLVLALAPDINCQVAPQSPPTAVPPKTADTSPAFVAPEITASTPAVAAPGPVSPDRIGSFSAETSAKISANAPKFTPPANPDSKAEDLPDLRDSDKPRNGIIRLPKVMVQEPKQPKIKERDLLTPQAKIALAYK